MLVVTKFYNDVFYRNEDIAQACGVPVQELNLMERCFLSFLDYRLFVSEAEFNHYEQGMRLHFSALDRAAASATGSRTHLL